VLDSLLKQSIAVLAAAILGALMLSLLLIAALVLRPQIERSAADTAQLIRTLDRSFQPMDPLGQDEVAGALRVDEGRHVLVTDAAPNGTTRPRSWYAWYFLHVLSDRTGIAASDLVIDDDGRLWVRMATAEQPYWLLLRTLPVPDPVAGLALACGIALLTAFAGGVTLQRRIARPLKRVEDAVSRLGDPTDPFAMDVEGPREIAAVSRALADMSARLQAAEADRALMLAGVSHDLRTPLTKLRLALAMLKDADAELVAGAERNVIRIESMLGQFLDFARGFDAEAKRPVPLRSLLMEAIEGCADPASVALEAPADAVIEVKETALLRALDNLLTNAFRHGKPPVVICAEISNGDLTIDVRDAGNGFSTESARELIRPFARGTAARAGEGTGLGLAIVAQVARAHRGEVEFAQDAASFTVRLRLPQEVGARE